jgi:hypothetical protein
MMDVKHHERIPPIRFGQISFFPVAWSASFVRPTAAGCELTSRVCVCVQQSRPTVLPNEYALPASSTYMAQWVRIPALSPRCASFVGPHSRFACVAVSWCNHWLAKIIAAFYFRKAVFLRKLSGIQFDNLTFLMNYVSRSYKLSILYFFMNFRPKLRKL